MWRWQRYRRAAGGQQSFPVRLPHAHLHRHVALRQPESRRRHGHQLLHLPVRGARTVAAGRLHVDQQLAVRQLLRCECCFGHHGRKSAPPLTDANIADSAPETLALRYLHHGSVHTAQNALNVIKLHILFLLFLLFLHFRFSLFFDFFLRSI